MSQFLQQLLNKAKEKADALDQAPLRPSKKRQGNTDTQTVSDTVPGPDLVRRSDTSTAVSDPGSVSDPPPASDLASVSDLGSVSDTPPLQFAPSIFSAYTALQSKIHKYLPHISASELRLYLYLVDLAFAGSQDSDGVVEYNQREVMKSVGFGSHSTAVKVLASLTEKHLVAWVCKASKKGEKSMLRVMLPPDVSAS